MGCLLLHSLRPRLPPPPPPLPPHPQKHTHTSARTHAHTHARTHAHTHSVWVVHLECLLLHALCPTLPYSPSPASNACRSGEECQVPPSSCLEDHDLTCNRDLAFLSLEITMDGATSSILALHLAVYVSMPQSSRLFSRHTRQPLQPCLMQPICVRIDRSNNLSLAAL